MNRACIACVLALLTALLIGCSGIRGYNLPAEPVAAPKVAALPERTSSSSPSPTRSPSPTPSPTPGPPTSYSLAFSDEFDADQIDESVWSFELGPWPYNQELECYTRENAWLEDGVLVIEAREETLQNRSYTSARLKTQNKLDFTYGYLEIRAALPTGRGTWSAIWLLPTDLRYGGYLHSGEIDIAERVGYDAKRVHSTVHTYLYNSVYDNAITASTRLSRKDDSFHTYGLLWQEDGLFIYFDGILSLQYRRPLDATPDSWPFDVPFHLILNLAVGGTWGGIKGVDAEAFPQRMLVDYVRYYTAVPANIRKE